MKLVVGLGNPGKRYQGTRHNVGFEIVAELARSQGLGSFRERFHGETAEYVVGSEKILLLRPLTFMNLSGQSVLEARDFYKVEDPDILVVCDDFQLPLGRLRFRLKGSSGGQKGLADILHRLGTDTVPRLRIGIGPPLPGWDPADFVLGKFDQAEISAAREVVIRGSSGVRDWIVYGTAHCMNVYNADEKKGNAG